MCDAGIFAVKLPTLHSIRNTKVQTKIMKLLRDASKNGKIEIVSIGPVILRFLFTNFRNEDRQEIDLKDDGRLVRLSYAKQKLAWRGRYLLAIMSPWNGIQQRCSLIR